ncbi:MAG: Holliday junction resolvase RuvX [Candidatus Paceibacterota bacterium]
MRFLGIDYGEKRIGIAISDENLSLAFPKEIIPNDAKLLGRIGEILEEENISEIVVGESVNLDGSPNKIGEKINSFIEVFREKFNLPVHTEKEFLTSVEARKSIEGKSTLNTSQAHSRAKEETSERYDASAAALILQRFLDKKNKK